jgi:hypothetical protein
MGQPGDRIRASLSRHVAKKHDLELNALLLAICIEWLHVRSAGTESCCLQDKMCVQL